MRLTGYIRFDDEIRPFDVEIPLEGNGIVEAARKDVPLKLGSKAGKVQPTQTAAGTQAPPSTAYKQFFDDLMVLWDVRIQENMRKRRKDGGNKT